MFSGFPTEKQTFAFCHLPRTPRPWTLARRYKMRLDYCSLPPQTRLILTQSFAFKLFYSTFKESSSTHHLTLLTLYNTNLHKSSSSSHLDLGLISPAHMEGHVLNHIFVLRYHSVGRFRGRRGCRARPHTLRCAGPGSTENNAYYLTISKHHPRFALEVLGSNTTANLSEIPHPGPRLHPQTNDIMERSHILPSSTRSRTNTRASPSATLPSCRD
jgi:hypothetical protein